MILDLGLATNVMGSLDDMDNAAENMDVVNLSIAPMVSSLTHFQDTLPGRRCTTRDRYPLAAGCSDGTSSICAPSIRTHLPHSSFRPHPIETTDRHHLASPIL